MLWSEYRAVAVDPTGPTLQPCHSLTRVLQLSHLLVTRLDLRDIRVTCKVGGTIDDSELVDGCVFDQKVGDFDRKVPS